MRADLGGRVMQPHRRPLPDRLLLAGKHPDGGAKVGAGIESAGRRADCGAVDGGDGTVRHATDDLPSDRTLQSIRGRGASHRLDDPRRSRPRGSGASRYDGPTRCGA